MNTLTLRNAGRLGRRASTRLAGLAAIGVIAVLLVGCGDQRGSSSGKVMRSHTAAPPVSAHGASEAPLAALLSRQRSEPRPIAVTTTARGPGGVIDRRYTCRGADQSLPVRWSGVPRGAKEIAVFVITLGHSPPTLNWAVAGLRPSLGGILAGRLPARSIVGRNSFGNAAYSLCPTASAVPVILSIVVVALPRRLTLHRGFDASALFTEATKSAGYHGSVVMLAGKLTTSGAKGGG
jgi:phosphatidylethanolamine-binding protein (PEBP) family uncharacterized protein